MLQVFAYDAEDKLLRTGSGYFVSPEGRFLTAWQVLLGASRAMVMTAEGKEYPVQIVVAGNGKTGLLLGMAGPLPGPPPHLTLAKQMPQVGERVIALGATGKTHPLVGEGVVSSILEFPDHGKVIHISVPITSKSWGGPVVNDKGEALGVAISGTLSGQKYNFALPAMTLAELKETPQAFPYWAQAHSKEALGRCFKKADAAEKAGSRKDVLGWYKEAVRIKPDDARARTKLGVAYYKDGLYKESLEQFRQAARFKPDDPQMQLNLGLAALKAGQRPEAERALEALNQLDPKMAQKLQASLKASPGTTPAAAGAAGQVTLPELFNRIKPAVVFVENYDSHKKRLSLSSGFFINAQGHFITNYHCLRGGSSATVRTSDGKRYPVKLILAEDKFNDLMLAAIDPPPAGVPYLPVTGALPQVGEEVIALGNPKGLEWTLSTGIVSAIRGYPTPQRQVVQITAPMSPGSSGGPILNRKGQVVAVFAFYHLTGQNLNFGPPGKLVLALKPNPGKTMEQRAQEWLAEAQELTRQGTEHLQKKDLKKAAKTFEEAILSRPDYALAHYNLAYVHYLNNNQDGFKKEYAKLKEIDSKLTKELDTLTRKVDQKAKKGGKPSQK
ncbi:MAG: tetratricopeptide repeat protein [Deltaproteobacteria bacterium]|nr:tetratricopeptide repeat protein [Deltaproteobacteria bacterium]